MSMNHGIAQNDQPSQLDGGAWAYRAFAASPAGMLAATVGEDRVVDVNRAWLAMTGYERHEIIDGMIGKLGLFPQANDWVKLKLLLETSGQTTGLAVALKHKNGTALSCQVSAERIDGNESRHHLFIFTPAAALDVPCPAPQSRQDILRQVLDSVPQSLFWKDLNSVYVGCNQAFARTVGLERVEDIIGKTDFELPWPSAEAETYREDDRQVMASNQAKRHIVEPLQDARGRRIWIDTTKVPLTGPDHRVNGVLGVYEDVSIRKEYEQTIRAAAEVMSAIPSGLFIYHFVAPDLLYLSDANPAALKMTRLDLAAVRGREFNEIWPAARERGITDQFIKAAQTGQPYHFEDIFYDDGRFAGAYKVVAFPISGHRMGVAFEDITEQKNSENSMRESELRYRQLFNSMTSGFALHEVIPDETGRPGDYRFLEINPAFERITGLQAAQIIGRTVREVMPDTEPYWIETYGRVAAGGPPQQFENYSQALNKYFEIVVYSPSPGRFATIFRDITHHKQTEEALNRRIVALTQPLDDPSNIQFADLFNPEDIQAIQDKFAEATGVASIITDPQGRPLTRPSNFCRLCRDIIRQTEKGRANCFVSDATLGRHHPEGPIVSPCLSGGLWDAGASITVGGRHIANWMIGQVRNEAQDDETLLRYADTIGADREQFRQALAEVPVMSAERFNQVAGMLFAFANELSLKAYQNIQQARFIRERKETEATLRASEERFRNLFDTMAQGVVYQDAEGKVTLVNRAALDILGFSEAQILGHTSDHPQWRAIHEDGTPCPGEEHPAMIALRTGQEVKNQVMGVFNPIRQEFVWLIISAVPQFRPGETKPWHVFATFEDITERKRAEKELQSAHNKLQALWSVSSLADASLKSVADHVLVLIGRMMDSQYAFYGFVSEDETVMTIHSWSGDAMRDCSLVDKPMRFLIAEAGVWGEAIRRRKPLVLNDYSSAHPAKKGLPAGHVPLKNLLVVPHFAHGKIISVAAVANRPGDFSPDDVVQLTSFLNSVQAITESKRAEEALRESENHLREAQRIARLGRWELDLSSQRLTWSDTLYAVFELDPAHFTPTYEAFLQAIHPDDRDKVAQAYASSLQNRQPYQIEHRLLMKDDRVKWVAEQCHTDFSPQGQALRSVGIVQDITEQVRQRQELEQRNEEMTRFTYTVSHDLKSPLVTIKSFLGYLRQDWQADDRDKAQADMSFIGNAVEKMGLLLQELLELLRIGRVVNEPETIGLDELVQEALDLVAGRFAEQAIKVVLPHQAVILFGDRRRLRELYQNLLDNAAKFMGGQARPLVEIGVEAAAGELVLFVRDNGAGIDPKYHHKIFDLFEKLETGVEGTGIGLTLAKRIVEVHGGRIWVESPGLGLGTTFKFTLKQSRLKTLRE